MAIVISVFLQKGGSGKTTTAINFCAFAGFRGYKVLLIDIDGQSNATMGSLTKGMERSKYTVADVLTDTCTINEAITKCKYYDLLATNIEINNLDVNDVFTLKRKLQEINKPYDYIVIDCPPNTDDLTINALVASNTIIVPIEPTPFNYAGLYDLSQTINLLHTTHANDELSILGILLVKSKTRNNLDWEMRSLLNKAAKEMGTTLFDCSIRECTAIPTCQFKQIMLPDYKPKQNNGAMDYNGFVTKAIKRLEEMKK